MTTLASKAVARAMATAWRWPPDSSSTVLVDALHMDLELVEMSFAISRAFAVDDGEAAELAARLAAEIDVLVDRHVPGEREILIDHLDADVAAHRAGSRNGPACPRR